MSWSPENLLRSYRDPKRHLGGPNRTTINACHLHVVTTNPSITYLETNSRRKYGVTIEFSHNFQQALPTQLIRKLRDQQ